MRRHPPGCPAELLQVEATAGKGSGRGAAQCWVGAASLGELLRAPWIDSNSWHGRARVKPELGGGKVPASIKGVVSAPTFPIVVGCPKTMFRPLRVAQTSQTPLWVVRGSQDR